MKPLPVQVVLMGVTALSVIAACMPAAAPPTVPPPAPSPTSVILYAPSATPVAPPPTEEPSSTPGHPDQTALPAVDECAAFPEGVSTRYDITANMNYAERTVQVQETVDYRNDTGDILDQVVFWVAPNKQPNVFSLDQVRLHSLADAPPGILEGVRLTVSLPDPLLPGCSQELTLTYRLQLPLIGNPYFPRQGYFGHSGRQINLGEWIPVIAPYRDGVWVTPIPINVGEQAVIPAGDYRVTLNILDAPPELVVVGPGEADSSGAQWRFSLPAARGLTISMSDQYHRLSTTSRNGVLVEIYTLDDAQPGDDSGVDAPAHALETAAAAVELYADLYGPYPYNRLVVIESDFPDGMEFSGLVFVGGEWFRSYQGNPASYLTLITAHEVAHQWWYGLVANDQGYMPWLDEALTTYSEYVYLQENYPNLTDWWWNFRVNAYAPEGNVDSSVYEFETVRGYINAVYLRGAQLMHAVRQAIGTEAFFAWLQRYAETMRHGIAAPDDLWEALPPDLLSQTEAIRRSFLRDSGPTS